jgi:hypothetical protein
MADTIRQQIIDAIDTQLKTILVSNGYYTDLGLTVQEWDLTPLDPDNETERLEYRDEEESRLDLTVGEQTMGLPLAIRVLTAGDTSVRDIREMLADVAKAMYEDPTWGALASDTNQEGLATLDKAEAADQASGVEVRFLIEYTVARGES